MADQSDTNNSSGSKPKGDTPQNKPDQTKDKPSGASSGVASSASSSTASSAVITPTPPKAESAAHGTKKNPTAPLKSDNNVKKTTSASDNPGTPSATSPIKNEKNQKPAKTGILWFVTIVNLLILLLVVVWMMFGITEKPMKSISSTIKALRAEGMKRAQDLTQSLW